MGRKTQEESLWGTDGVVSMPKTYNPDTVKIPMEGFCFTPMGLVVDITETDREELLRSGYAPPTNQGVERGT